jgi:hypothetical protein
MIGVSIFNQKWVGDHFLAYYFEHVVCKFLAKETSHQRLQHAMVSLSQQLLYSTNFSLQGHFLYWLDPSPT